MNPYNIREPPHGVLGSRDNGGPNNQGPGSRVGKSMKSLGSGAQRNLGSREQRKINREQPKNDLGSREIAKIISGALSVKTLGSTKKLLSSGSRENRAKGCQ